MNTRLEGRIVGPGTDEVPLSPTRILSDICKHPAGESHALPPLPRPANCTVARETMGEGSARRKDGFLSNIVWVLETTSPYMSASPMRQVSGFVSSVPERNSSTARKKADGENFGVCNRSSSEVRGFEGTNTCLIFGFERESGGMSSSKG